MKRRTFLTLPACLAAAYLAGPFAVRPPMATAALDRLTLWKPDPQKRPLVEWRYVAGRVVNGAQDYGFVVSLSEIRVSSLRGQELLVQRQDLTGAQQFAGKTYAGKLTYDAATATLAFQGDQAGITASWQWDAAAQVYRLTVAAPELTLNGMILRPQGALIPEGGSGDIKVGQFRGIRVDSDYHADWNIIELEGAARGTARLDIQGLRPVLGSGPVPVAQPAQTTDDYDHHWFAIAAEQNGAPVWISAWRIETGSTPHWCLTVARGSGASWQVVSYTEESTDLALLEVQALLWQPVPQLGSTPQPQVVTGARWHISAGVTRRGDLLDIEVAVPPGQFAVGSRQIVVGGQSALEEGVGNIAAGTLGGRPLSNVTLVVAETSAEFYARYLPATLK